MSCTFALLSGAAIVVVVEVALAQGANDVGSDLMVTFSVEMYGMPLGCWFIFIMAGPVEIQQLYATLYTCLLPS